MNKQEVKNRIKASIDGLLPAIKINNNAQNRKEALFSFSNKLTNTFINILTYSEKALFDSPIRILLEQKVVSDNYSEHFIQTKIIELCHLILADESKIEVYVEKLISFLLKNTNKYFLVFSEVENIRILDDQAYNLIDSTIKIIKKEDLPFAEDNILIVNTSWLLNKPSIFTRVKAGDEEKAKDLALHNFTISFNLLKLYIHGFKPALKGCLLSGNQELTVYNETDKELSSSLSKVGELPLNTAYLDTDFYNRLKEGGVDELRNDNTISNVVKECLYWFGLGLDEKHISSQLLNFVTVLEATLKKEEESTELSRAISERGALLLSDNFKDRKRNMENLKMIYRIRHKVVHKGRLIEDKYITHLSGTYAKAVLITLIKMSKRFNGNFDAFINYLDDIKLRGTP